MVYHYALNLIAGLAGQAQLTIYMAWTTSGSDARMACAVQPRSACLINGIGSGPGCINARRARANGNAFSDKKKHFHIKK